MRGQTLASSVRTAVLRAAGDEDHAAQPGHGGEGGFGGEATVEDGLGGGLRSRAVTSATVSRSRESSGGLPTPNLGGSSRPLAPRRVLALSSCVLVQVTRL